MLNCEDHDGVGATIDQAGRIIIRTAIRTATHLDPGTEVRFRLVVPKHAEIEFVPLCLELEPRGRLGVARPRRV